MSPIELRNHLRRSPFRPFRVHLSDGTAYDVPHPEMAHVTRTEMVISLEIGADDIPDHNVYCDPLHITRIEPLKNGMASESAKSGEQ